jgi:uncharacterized protein (DUF58 family)
VSDGVLTFPLLSRRRGLGNWGLVRASTRRGGGYEIASSRPYQRGDTVRSIDWKASARISSARETDDFIVREHFAEEVPRVVVVVDRRPEMSLYPEALPWLHKPAAVAAAGEMILDSAAEALGLVGYLDIPDPQSARWLRPGGSTQARQIRGYLGAATGGAAPRDNLGTCLRSLVRLRRHLPVGSFVFVLSDLLAPPPPSTWQMVASLGWDVVPVIVQDPRWEQSFPAASGVALPVTDANGNFELVRLRRGEAAQRRADNQRRLATLQRDLTERDVDPVLLSSAEPGAIHAAFLQWHDRRLLRMGRR